MPLIFQVPPNFISHIFPLIPGFPRGFRGRPNWTAHYNMQLLDIHLWIYVRRMYYWLSCCLLLLLNAWILSTTEYNFYLSVVVHPMSSKESMLGISRLFISQIDFQPWPSHISPTHIWTFWTAWLQPFQSFIVFHSWSSWYAAVMKSIWNFTREFYFIETIFAFDDVLILSNIVFTE